MALVYRVDECTLSFPILYQFGLVVKNDLIDEKPKWGNMTQYTLLYCHCWQIMMAVAINVLIISATTQQL